MSKVYLRVLAAKLALLLVLVPSTRVGEAQHSAIDTYAITNARVVTVSGPVIERGTVIIRDGLIAAVGASVVAPALVQTGLP